MFPRAHTYSYMLASWRMAWYKLHYPMEFYKVMLEVRCKDGFDAEHMAFGKEGFEEFAKFIRSDYAANTSFVMDARQTCMLLHDYYDHGFSFRVSDNQLPDGETFRIADAHTIEVDGSKYKRNPDSYDEDEMYFF